MPFRIACIEETGSTNTDVLRLAAAGSAGAGFALMARRQTAGRGRVVGPGHPGEAQHRGWVMLEGDLAVTYCIGRPPEGFPLSAAASLAAIRSLGHWGVQASCKWPNDVLAGGRKLCGILAEAVPGRPLVAVGIGINLVRRFRSPAGAALPAGSVEEIAGARPAPLAAARLLGQCLGETLALDAEAVVAGWWEHCVHRNARVRVIEAGRTRTGTAVGVAADGRLLVDFGGGAEPVASADVEHLRF